MSSVFSSCPSIELCSNLENFLYSVTPIISYVPSITNNSLPLHSNDVSENTHLKLQDIWESYDEWSACGVPVSVKMETGERVIQFLAPSLSAIQIFKKKSPSTTSEEDTKSVLTLQFGSSSDEDRSTKTNEFSWRNGVPSNDEGNHDHLYMQYIESCSPYSRMPFLEKIVELGQNYPGLFTFNIDDISPASWMSIAWYPIYPIPDNICRKDLCTCFLTFHTLSSSFQDNNEEENVEKEENVKVLDLAPFGLASYKMQRDVWINRPGDDDKIKDLESAAFSWLRQLNIHHPDFNFFTQ